MNIVIGIVRVLIVLLIVRLVVHMFMGRRAPQPRRSRSVPERAGGTLVRDPHCGTYVSESRAIAAGTQHFCSTTCRDAWLAAHGQATHSKA